MTSAIRKEYCGQHLKSSEQRILSFAYNGIITGLSVLDGQVTDLRETALNSM